MPEHHLVGNNVAVLLFLCRCVGLGGRAGRLECVGGGGEAAVRQQSGVSYREKLANPSSKFLGRSMHNPYRCDGHQRCWRVVDDLQKTRSALLDSKGTGKCSCLTLRRVATGFRVCIPPPLFSDTKVRRGSSIVARVEGEPKAVPGCVDS